MFAREKMNSAFPVLGKLDCEKGVETHPFYQFLKDSKPILPSEDTGPLKWNFVKFLINENGKVSIIQDRPNIMML